MGRTTRHVRGAEGWISRRPRGDWRQCNRAGGSKVYYRLYLIRKARFRDAIDLHAADDASALMEAEHLTAGLPAELWCRGRRVATLLGADAA